MDKVFHNVGDLPFPERSAVEAIMGRALRDDQQLYIVALDATVEPTQVSRHRAWSEIEAIFAESHHNARQAGVSQEALERIVDDACDEARYG